MSSPLELPDTDADEVSEEYVEIPDWHRKIIEEQLAEYEVNGSEWRTWEEFEKELIKLQQELIKELAKK